MSNTLMGNTPWMFKESASVEESASTPSTGYTIVPEGGEEPNSEITSESLKAYIQGTEFRDQLIEVVIAMADLQRISFPNSYDLTDPSIGTDDKNPFDNIARAEIFKILNFRKLSKVKVRNALDAIAAGQEPHLEFMPEENDTLLEQAKELELISEDKYEDLKDVSYSLFSEIPEGYKKLLNIQLKLPHSIPTEEELQLAGIQAIILETVRTNPEAVVDEALIQQYTEAHIDHILLTSDFIGWSATSKIIRNPYNIFDILNKATIVSLLNRVRGYLPFVTEEKINTISAWYPGEYDIGSLFTEDQIRMVVDKELDIKNLVLKALSFEEVQNLFNRLSEEFKVEFKESFTEEKMKGLIEAVILEMYPPLSIQDFITEAATALTVIGDIPPERISAVSNRVNNMFLMPLEPEEPTEPTESTI